MFGLMTNSGIVTFENGIIARYRSRRRRAAKMIISASRRIPDKTAQKLEQLTERTERPPSSSVSQRDVRTYNLRRWVVEDVVCPYAAKNREKLDVTLFFRCRRGVVKDSVYTPQFFSGRIVRNIVHRSSTPESEFYLRGGRKAPS